MTKKIKYTDGPIGEIKVVRDFLPPAAKLAFRTSKSELAEMARREAAREDGIDVVAIVTPNHLHARIASAFLDAGIDVMARAALAESRSGKTRKMDLSRDF